MKLTLKGIQNRKEWEEKGRWLRLVCSADTVQAGTGFLIVANTPSHLTGTILRAACHGTTNLKATAFEWLR